LKELEGSGRDAQTLSRQMLLYLVDHPDAKDTAEGILKWWIPAQGGDQDQELVQETLNELVARGWVARRKTATSEVIYGLSKERLPQIREFLNQPIHEAKPKG
jgi:hypothetical protein